MININNKPWNKLVAKDIGTFLSSFENESIYFELKSDDVETSKLMKEVVAFSNTYGGYIFLGVEDDKTIKGCKKWNEQKIHTAIYDSVFPTPIVDVKRFTIHGNKVYVIRIEEGTLPPYVTNKGVIYSRVSSGSCPVNEQSKLNILYMKRQDQIKAIKEKIELPEPPKTEKIPNNLCGYIDFGFSLLCSQPVSFQKDFYTFDMTKISDYLKSLKNPYSISRVGDSYSFTIGTRTAHGEIGDKTVQVLMPAGYNNFLEIMYDGSIRSRLVLTCNGDTGVVDVLQISNFFTICKEIYKQIIKSGVEKIFVNAHRYNSLCVIKQFYPKFVTKDYLSMNNDYKQKLNQVNYLHNNKYQMNFIVNSNRVPKSNYDLIDRQLFDKHSIKYDYDNLIRELFTIDFINLGFIEKIEFE